MFLLLQLVIIVLCLSFIYVKGRADRARIFTNDLSWSQAKYKYACLVPGCGWKVWALKENDMEAFRKTHVNRHKRRT